MNVIFSLVALALIMVWTPWLWRYKVKPYFAKSDIDKILKNHPHGKQLKENIRLLNTLYRGINSRSVSHRERKRLGYTEDGFIYGEIEFLSFVLLLDKINPQKGEVFYDLGCGAGKPVFTAALCYDLSKACGIELLPGLVRLANIQLKKATTLVKLQQQTQNYLPRLERIQFINANFLHCDITDGDIIFINATCLHYHVWQSIIEKLLHLKQGSRVIVTSKKIQHEHFKTLYQGSELMSWGMNAITLYEKIN